MTMGRHSHALPRRLSMFGIPASIVDWMLVGSVYGMAAMGLTLIWGVMNVANLTHGALIVTGMFAFHLIGDALGMPAYAVLHSTPVIGFAAGALLYWLAVHRMIGQSPLTSLLSVARQRNLHRMG